MRQLHKFFKSTVNSIFLLILLSNVQILNAQVKLLEQIKISDEVMFFDGVNNENSTNKDVNAPYDYSFGSALTPHGDCIKAYKEFVFMTWYRGGKEDRHVMLTRYNTKTGALKTIEFPHQHTGFEGKWWVGETHNTIAVGICPKDETIHLVYDLHRNGTVQQFVDNDDCLRYSYSVKGGAVVADENFTLESTFVNSSKGNYKHSSFPGITDMATTNMLTYPAFFTNDEGDLFLKNRHGYAANGKLNFCMYNGTKWEGYTDFNKSNQGGGELNGAPSTHNWGIYGDMKFFNGKIRIGFQQRLGNTQDKYQYQNGIYYAYTDDPSGKTQWKDYKGTEISNRTNQYFFYEPHRIKVAEPGDFVQTTQKDMVYIVGGFDWTVTDNEDIHIVSEVKDKQYNVTKRLHTYKSAVATEFTTVEYNAGSELYAAGNDVYVIGLKNGRVNIVKTEGGTSNFQQVYQHSTGPVFDKGIVNVENGKLYYYLKEQGGSGAKRTTYLQVFDLDIDTTPTDTSRYLSFKGLYNNQEIEPGTNLSIEANVGSAYKEVSLWSGTINLGTKTTAPYVWSGHAILTDMSDATYTFRLVAKDSSNVEDERIITIKTKLPNINVFSGQGVYKIYNPNKSKWLGYDVATDDALVTVDGDADINKFNIIANGGKFNILTGDNQKALIINAATGYTAMLATPTSELLQTADALFRMNETTTGSELYLITNDGIDAVSGLNFNLNVKSDGSDIGRGTTALANYQWRFTRLGDVPTGIKNINQNKVRIYPNPAKDLICIDGTSVSNASIYALSGQLLKTVYVNNNQIDISSFITGMYLLKAKDNNGNVFNLRFMVD